MLNSFKALAKHLAKQMHILALSLIGLIAQTDGKRAVIAKLIVRPGLYHIENAAKRRLRQRRNRRTDHIPAAILKAGMPFQSEPFPGLRGTVKSRPNHRLADLGNLYLGERLTMALLFAVVLLRLLLKDDDLLALAVAQDLALNLDAFHYRRAHLDACIVLQHQHVEIDVFALGYGQLLNENRIADLNFILLTTSLNNRVHFCTSSNQSRC